MPPELLRPPRLRPRDTIALVAPSSMSSGQNIGAGLRVYEEEGFRVRVGATVRKMLQHRFFSAPREDRLADLHDAFADDGVDAVFCIRGGIGAQELLPHLDLDVIRDHPKAFMGYSDITALHVALHQGTGLVTFHGPSGGVSTSGSREDVDRRRQNLRDGLVRLQDGDVWGEIRNPEDGPLLRIVREGEASGRLHGGNLTLLASLMGTPWEVDLRDRILFLEGVHLDSHAVWRNLVQLETAGKLAGAAGVVVGEFSDRPDPRGPTPSVEEVVGEVLGRQGIPVVEGLQCGHGDYRVVVPVGARATLDAVTSTLRVDERVLD